MSPGKRNDTTMLRAGLLASLAFLPAELATHRACAQCTYEVQAILRAQPCEPFALRSVSVLGLNELGQAVGTITGCDDPNLRSPFVWAEDFGVIELPMPAGFVDGEARAINNVGGSDGIGQIICSLRHFTAPQHTAFLYDDGQWTIIPPTFGHYSSAQSINDLGQVTGVRMTENGLCGFRWQSGTFTNIQPAQQGAFALANDINAKGHVAGELAGPNSAFVWDGKNLFDLGSILSGPSAFAIALNLQGDMTGGAFVPIGRSGRTQLHAFIFDSRTGQDLAIPPGFDASIGIDINDARQVLVRANDFRSPGGAQTYLWQNDALDAVDQLVEPPAGVTVGRFAEAVNNHGQIVVNGEFNGESVGLIIGPSLRRPGDVNLDCFVDSNDLLTVIESWGPCPQLGSCLADVVCSATLQPPGDGTVDGADLAFVLGNWAPAPDDD